MLEQKKGYGKLWIQTSHIFLIMRKWLYWEHDIFLREQVSNGVIAMHKHLGMRGKRV